MFVTKVCKICVLWLVNGIMIVDTKSNRNNICSKLFLTCNYGYSWPAHPMYTPRCSYYICMHLSTILYSDVLSFAPNCCVGLMTALIQVTFPEITNDIYKDSCCIGLYGNLIGRTSECMTWKTLVWRWGCSRKMAWFQVSIVQHNIFDQLYSCLVSDWVF